MHTSSVITKPSKPSLTRKKASESSSFVREASTAVPSRVTRVSQRSSTSRSERKFPVVLRTWTSMMKNPTSSCVTEKIDDEFKGSGRIRSACAL